MQELDLRILHFENNPADAELVKIELQRNAIYGTLTIVRTGPEYEKALCCEQFDLILSDFSFPAYDGAQALEYAKKTCPHIPFIFVTGEMGEDRAIESLKQGAVDYVMKDRLKKLAPAVHRAIEIDNVRREQRATAEALKQSEEHYRKLAEMSPDAIITHVEGKIVYINPAGLKLYGAASIGEVVGKSIMDFVHPDYREIVRQRNISMESHGGVSPLLEEKLLRLDGSVLNVEVAAISYPVREKTAIQKIIRDITDRKRAEEALRQSQENYAITLASIGDGVIATDAAGKVTFMNPVAEELTGRTLQQSMGRAISDVLQIVHETTGERLPSPAEEVLREGTILVLAKHAVLLREDGTRLPIDDSGAPIRNRDGKITGTVVVFRDISEKRQAEEALRESNLKYQKLFENKFFGLTYGEIITDEQGQPVDYRLLEVNDAFETITGLRREDVVGKTRRKIDYGFESYIDEVIRTFGKVALSGDEVTIEQFNEQSKEWHLIFAFSPKPGYFISMFTDITERKRQEEQLRKLYALANRRAAELNAVIESMPDAVYIGTMEGITMANKNALRMLGARSLKDLQERVGELGRKFAVRWPDTGQLLREDELQFTRALRGETAIEEVLATNAQTGEDIYIRSACAPIVEEGTVIGAVAINSDITERKKAEETLRLSEEKFSKVFHGNAAGMVISRIHDGAIIDVNSRWCELMGYSREEAIGKTSRAINMWKHAEDRAHIAAELARSGTITNREYTLVRKNGEEWTCLLSAHTSWLHGEKVFISSALDVSERKKTEEALRESKERFRSVLQNMSEGLMLFDINGNVIYQNPASLRIHGFDQQENAHMGRDFLKATWNGWDEQGRPLPPDGWPMSRVLRQERFQNQVLHARRVETGLEFDASYNGSPIYDLAGNHILGVITIRDITEEMRALRALRESEERFRTLADNIPQLTWIADETGWIFWYNKQWYEYTGTTPEEMQGWGWQKVHHPEYVGKITEEWQASIQTGQPYDNSFPLRGKDGSYRWFLTRVTPIRDEQGIIKRWFGTNTDITDRKYMEEELQRTLAEAEEGRNTLRALMEYIPMGVTIAEAPDVTIRMVSKHGQQILERAESEIAYIPAPEHPSTWGIYRADGVTPGTPEELPLTRATVNGEVVKNEEWVVTRRDGTLVPILCNAAPIRDTGGTVVGGVIGWQDITERKHAENLLKVSLAEKELLLREIHHRVKNNLQLVGSMLHLQSRQINDPDIRKLFEENRNRIRTIALVHEKLYGTKNLSTVDIADYLGDLASSLVRSHARSDDAVTLQLAIPHEPMKIETAMPVGLIVNELVLNALKHGLNKAQEGQIRIELGRATDGIRTLTVADSGEGFPESVDFQNSGSFGLQLVAMLVKGLDGTVENRTNGAKSATITITFKEPNYTERI